RVFASKQKERESARDAKQQNAEEDFFLDLDTLQDAVRLCTDRGCYDNTILPIFSPWIDLQYTLDFELALDILWGLQLDVAFHRAATCHPILWQHVPDDEKKPLKKKKKDFLICLPAHTQATNNNVQHWKQTTLFVKYFLVKLQQRCRRRRLYFQQQFIATATICFGITKWLSRSRDSLRQRQLQLQHWKQTT